MDVIVKNVQETVKSQQTVTQVQQIKTRHFEPYYQQHSQQYRSRSNLNHSYDPNMCTTAARFTDTFYANGHTTDTTSTAADLQAASSSTTGTPEEDLLCYNNVVLLHETAEIGAEAIVGNAELLEESPLLQAQIHVHEETFVSNYQFMHYTPHGGDVNTNTQMTGMIIQRSPNGHLYQNYMLTTENSTKDAPESVNVDQSNQQHHYHHHCDINMYDTHHAATVVDVEDTAAHLNSFDMPTQFTFQHETQAAATDENSVELMAKFAADLANLSNVAAQQYEPMNRQLAIASKDHQRMLLESTMSPLLAAVNDITNRDAELKTYFNQNVEKESILPTTQYLQQENMPYFTTKVPGQTKIIENTDNSSDEDDYLLVSDKPVECRAKASLPTNYLFFGNIDSNTHAPSVYAKKSIPHRTKFGPFEGEKQYVNEIDLDVLYVQTPRYYPLLMVDDSYMLDVANEDLSNWMRYIRLAQTYRQQNLHLLLEDGKIFFKCIRLIYPKEELRVGYHSSYAARFLLPILEPTVDDLKADFARMHPWKCFECDKRYATLDELRKHLKAHDDDDDRNELDLSSAKQRVDKKRKRKVCSKNKQVNQISIKCINKHLTTNSIYCKFCRKVFITNETFRQHMMKHKTHCIKRKSIKAIKNSCKTLKPKEPKCMYKCNLCAKRFHNELRFQQHKLTHSKNIAKPHVCVECQQQCATPAALAAHIRSHTGTQYNCVFCKEKFKYVRDFKKHVETHRTDSHSYQCMHCNKHYSAYHLLRKHVHIFHTTKSYNCDKCNKKFQNHYFLQRHMLMHSESKKFACTICNKRFNRKDHMSTHMKRMHNVSKIANRSKTAQQNKRSIISTKSESKMPTSTPPIEKLPNLEPLENNNPNKCDTQIVSTSNTNSKTEPIKTAKSTLPSSDISNLKFSPKKSTITATSTSTSSSNRRKQTPTKLKALELNAETVTYVALSEMLSPFIITEKDIHAEFKKPTKTMAAVSKEKQSSSLETGTEEIKPNNEIQAANYNLEKQLNRTTEEPSLQTHEHNILFSQNETDSAQHLYPFKCHICPHTSFKRRGILVNHFAKIHPTININEIELLSTPIIKQQIMFPCPYCTKIYKLNAKRKIHILKHHPGKELPATMRRKHQQNPMNSSTESLIPVGNITVNVHKCNICYKQYAARNRLVSHYRKSHPNAEIPLIQQSERAETKLLHQPVIIDDEHTTTGVESYHQELLEPEINIIPYHLQPPDSPENKLLKLSSAALELSRFDFLNERDRCSNDHLDSNVFADHSTHGELNRLPELFEEASIAGIDGTSMEKYSRSIEAQFFEKISKFS